VRPMMLALAVAAVASFGGCGSTNQPNAAEAEARDEQLREQMYAYELAQRKAGKPYGVAVKTDMTQQQTQMQNFMSRRGAR
jgi:hypothetical protein